MKEDRPIGIKIYGLILVLGSLLWALTPNARLASYLLTFDFLPRELAITRYALSVLGRIAGIVLGWGLLRRREFFRKTASLLFYAAIATVALRHPFELFVRQRSISGGLISFINNSWGQGQPMDNFDFIRTAYVILAVTHICFAASFILYFSRPEVKKHFR